MAVTITARDGAAEGEETAVVVGPAPSIQWKGWARRGDGPPPLRPVSREYNSVDIVGGMFSHGVNWRLVQDQIARSIPDRGHDDGSWAPIYLRLAWHTSGTYDPATGLGGSNGATMRFAPEKDYEDNKGLEKARRRLAGIKRMHRQLSHADLWTLAGAVAVSELGGPTIRWAPGRVDLTSASCPPDLMLPTTSDERPLSRHIRRIFNRMNFNDSEIVALIGGGHSVDECTEKQRLRGQMDQTADSFRELLDEHWVEERRDEFKSGRGTAGGVITMISTDITLKDNSNFREYAIRYRDNIRLFNHCVFNAFTKLLHLGVEHLL